MENPDLKSIFLRTDYSRFDRVSSYWRDLAKVTLHLPFPPELSSHPSKSRISACLTDPDKLSSLLNENLPVTIVNFLKAILAIHYLRNGHRFTLDQDVVGQYKDLNTQHDDAAHYIVAIYLAILEDDFGRALQFVKRGLSLAPNNPLLHVYNLYFGVLARDYSGLFDSWGHLRAHKDLPSTGLTSLLALSAFQAEYVTFGCSSAAFRSWDDYQDETSADFVARVRKVLPEVHQLNTGSRVTDAKYFLQADSVYFETWVVPLLLSAIENHIAEEIHVHLVNPTEASFRRAEQLSALRRGGLRVTYEYVSYDDFCAKSVYLSTTRLVRMYQFQVNSGNDYCLIDADMLFNKTFKLEDVSQGSAFVFGEDEPFWNCIAAGYALFRAKDSELLRFASRVVLNCIQQKSARWFLDQVAIAISTVRHEQSGGTFSRLSSLDYYDLSCNKQSRVWAITNDKNASVSTHPFLARKQQLVTSYAL